MKDSTETQFGKDGRALNGRYFLNCKERLLIEEGLKKNLTWKQIATTFSRPISFYTIRNEVNRNGGREGYDPKKAEKIFQEKLEKKKKLLRAISFNPALTYEGRDVRFRRSVDERLYTLEEQVKIIFEILQTKEKQ